MSSQPFAAFDIDGTIARTSLYHTLVDELVDRGLLPREVRQKYEDAKIRWRNREHPEAFNEYVQTLVGAYEPLMTQIKISDFEAAAEHLAERVKHHTYVYTRDLARDLKKKGYFLVAISGSQKEIVAPFAEHWGFDDYVAYEFERKDGKYTGKTNVTHTNKDVILKKVIARHDLSTAGSVAVGDSFGDVGLLSMVEQPIAFNPEKKLMAHAQKNGWKIVLERKNVIYQLEQHDGQYVLM